MKNSILGWWFARRGDDGEVRLPRGDGRIVRVGETLSVLGPVILCERGLHASVRAYDALAYAPGPMLCRVRLSGEIVRGEDKVAATERTCLAMIDATALLRTFAAGCALGALQRERAAGHEPDPRSWAAVDVAMRHASGAATDEDLAAAWAVARNVARNAARAAAWAAAWAVARAAAWAVAWNAARDAARDAAMDAAWNAARDAYTRSHADSLERLCLEATEAGVWP